MVAANGIIKKYQSSEETGGKERNKKMQKKYKQK